MKKLEDYIISIPDFPKPGVLWRDISGVLADGHAFHMALDAFMKELDGVKVDRIAAPESRGFIFGAALADRLGCAFVPIRKPGKLPRETISEDYELEYGTGTVFMHTDAVKPGENVVVVDDLLATGGTALAAARLVERLGGKVAKMLFLIELVDFAAKENALKNYDAVSLIGYEGE